MNEIATTTEPPERRPVQFSDEQKRILKSTVAQDHTDDELALFLSFCKSKGLDPFAREVYSIKRKGKVTFQIGIDGARAKAEETGEYDGQETYWCNDEGRWSDVWLNAQPPAAAKVIVYRRGCQKPFTGIAKWTEYKPDGDDWMWRKMASNQLAKCAESLALRKAFPNKLGGLYTGEEMQQADAAANPEPKRSIIQPKMKAAIPAAAEEPTPENPVIDFPQEETPPSTTPLPKKKALLPTNNASSFSPA
jgi:phage recombination protein Bet